MQGETVIMSSEDLMVLKVGTVLVLMYHFYETCKQYWNNSVNLLNSGLS